MKKKKRRPAGVTVMSATSCAGCGAPLELASSANGVDVTPSPGDFTICARCGQVLRYTCVPLLTSTKDLAVLEKNPQLSATLHRARGALRAFAAQRGQPMARPHGMIATVEWGRTDTGEEAPIIRTSDGGSLAFACYALGLQMTAMPGIPEHLKEAALVFITAIKGSSEHMPVEIYGTTSDPGRSS